MIIEIVLKTDDGEIIGRMESGNWETAEMNFHGLKRMIEKMENLPKEVREDLSGCDLEERIEKTNKTEII